MIHKMCVCAICFSPSAQFTRVKASGVILAVPVRLMSTLRCLPLFLPFPSRCCGVLPVAHDVSLCVGSGHWRAWAGRLGGSDAIPGSPCLFLSLDVVLSCSWVDLSLCTLLDALAGRGQVGDWEAAAPFLAGGCGGLLYQFSLQAGVDALPSPHEARLARSCWQNSADGLVLHRLHNRAQQLTVSG